VKRTVNIEELRAQLWGSFLEFCAVFYPIVTNRAWITTAPSGRESHYVSISRALTKCARLETTALVIGVPPGYGKSVMLSMWTAWCLSRYPDSQFLYISYGHELAAKHTAFIKLIVSSSAYYELFGVKIRQDSRAKDFFQTDQGGCIKAYGSQGAITGQDAGMPLPPGEKRFTGALILDDPTKPDEVHSDSIRGSVLRNWLETIEQRPRSPAVPVICIAQRLHEDDLPAYLMSDKEVRKFETLILPALDASGNALYPEVHDKAALLRMESLQKYVFASQFQQNPLPSSGGIYARADFVILPEDPKMLATFICCDTAETDKTYNDATVFSFFGVYFLDDGATLAVHWIDCLELFIEPKDLKDAFDAFYRDCMRYPVKPAFAAIEKKSTGVTLCSVLRDTRGLVVREIGRNAASGSKTARFLAIQQYVASKLLSFTFGMCHVEHVISHMTKITANESHRRDDICDTAADAVRIALIDRSVYVPGIEEQRGVVVEIANKFRNKMDVLNRGHRHYR